MLPCAHGMRTIRACQTTFEGRQTDAQSYAVFCAFAALIVASWDFKGYEKHSNYAAV